MTVREAASMIGCGTRWVRSLIRKGDLDARRVPYLGNSLGYRYEVNPDAVRAYRDRAFTRGRPRSNDQEN